MFHNAPAPLELRPLGKTGLQVTGLCIGAAPLGNMPATFDYAVGEERALETLRAVFAGPIKFVDTAASYGDGESERRIGTVLREIGGLPEGFVLASKADRDLKTGDFSGDQMRRSVERSLRLLGLEQIQLMYLHDPEHITFEQAMAAGGPVEVLQKCKEEGLIAHLGVAGGPLDLMARFVETDLFEVAISHNRYTLLHSSADGFWDLCGRHGVASVNAAPYGSGILAKGPKAYPRYAYEAASEKDIAKTKRIQEICSQYNVPLAAAALQFSLRDQRIAATVVGLTRPERIQQTVELAQHPIPAELWTELAHLKNMP
ncbi:MAG: aldo/keto reductase [Chloroflexota bacterium]|nr:aldo/keto reductase [Chloroflexota bacterium]